VFVGLTLEPEHRALQQSLRRFLDERAPLSAARSGVCDPAVWQQLTGQIGATAMFLPEHLGGGAGRVEAALVLEETGAVLLPGALLPTLTAIAAVGHCTDVDDLLKSWGDGRRTAALAVGTDGGRYRPDGVGVTWDGGRLTGAASYVIGGGQADDLLVLARAGAEVVLVGADSAHVRRTALDALDPTRPLARLEFEGVPGRVLPAGGDPATLAERVVAEAVLLLCAESVGVARAALEQACAYVAVREQFGRPVGSFQAVKHLLAKALVAVESSRSAVRYAAASVDAGGELVVRSSLVKAWCAAAVLRVAEDNIQAHGGIGYTWEHDAHLLLKRALGVAHLFGTAEQHRRAVLDHELARELGAPE
jgi:alkylation response protein AidB-like acyl-CoA dehydrogenase